MRNVKDIFYILILFLVLLTGCSTVKVPINVKTPGEFNISGVSKIAIVDFNSIKTDESLGVFSIDDTTKKVVKDLVLSEFNKNKLYEVCDLDIEKLILDENNIQLNKRFDSVLCGKVWWEITDEYRFTYPKIFKLSSWIYEKYDTGAKDLFNNPIYKVAKVVTSEKDVLIEAKYRSVLANLMLSLTMYKTDVNGKISKVVDTFAIASCDFILVNGVLVPRYNQLGNDEKTQLDLVKEKSESKSFFGGFKKALSKVEAKNDVEGKFDVTQKLNTIPTSLHANVFLSNKLVPLLVGKISTNTVKIDIEFSLKDSALYNLMKDGAYDAARTYIVTHLYNNNDDKLCNLIDTLSDYKPLITFVSEEDEEDEEYDDDDIEDFVDDNFEYLYMLALSEEALGLTDQALYSYRYIFSKVPSKEAADGISRCLVTIGMSHKVNEKVRSMRKASKASKVN